MGVLWERYDSLMKTQQLISFPQILTGLLSQTLSVRYQSQQIVTIQPSNHQTVEPLNVLTLPKPFVLKIAQTSLPLHP